MSCRDQGRALRHSFKNQDKKDPIKAVFIDTGNNSVLGLAGSVQLTQGWGQRDVMAQTLPKFGSKLAPPHSASTAEPTGAITSLFIEDPGGCSPRPEPGGKWELRQRGGSGVILSLSWKRKSRRGRSEELQGEQRGSRSESFGLECP